ncbi:MAG TPA: glycerophosphoryl diester phosphodiesterase membrane domain-containing protein [Gemmatimonadaceae bacterium]
MPATALRPRSATEIIDASFQLLRRHYTQLVAVAVVALLPYIVLVAVTGGATTDAATGVSGVGIILVFLAQWLCAALAEAAVIVGVSDAYLEGRVDITRSLASTVSRLPTIIGAGFVRGLAVLVGFIAFIFPAFYVMLRTFAIIPVVVLEEKSAGDSLSRSWELAKGEVGKIFLTLLLAWMIFFVLYFLLLMIVGMLASQNERAVSLVVGLLMALVYPITGVVTTLLYYDIRVRREGFDLELLAREAAPVAPSA